MNTTPISTGKYRVTHNLGRTGYSAAATAVGSALNFICNISARYSTYFEVEVRDTGGVPRNAAFSFQMFGSNV